MDSRSSSGGNGVGLVLGANRVILLGAIPILAVLGLAAYALFTFAAGERAEQGWVTHTYEVMDSLRTVLGDAADAETGQRGYLLTKRQSYLQPYRDARARLDRDLGRFQDLTRDNPAQQIRAHQLRELLTDRYRVLDQGLVIGSREPLATPDLLPLLDQGKAMMDATRSAIAMALAEEKRLLGERIEARRAVERNEILTAVLLTVLALIVLLVAGVMLVRNNVRLALSEAIRARQARILQATLDNIRDGVVVFDASDKVAAFNEIFFRLMDFPKTLAAMGTALGEFRAIDKKLDRVHFDEVPETAADTRQDYARLQRGGSTLDVYKAGIGADGFLVAAADVTDRVRSEATVRQAQKMEAVGQLTGGVAHDFNNLLQIISANLDLAVADAKTDHKTAERLQAAIGAVERGSRLTAQLLAFARRQALESRSIHPGRLVQDMTDMLRRTLGERIEVESIVAGGLWNTMVDVNQLQNAILNLAINARDAMPDGGRLTIEVANAYLDDDYAAAHAEVIAGQYVMIAITDTGTGMAPDVLARAFDPFFTTKPEGKGTGLGLSQVYGFVKQSSGHVKIYSEIGHGTAIKLYLPRSRKPQERVEPTLSAPIRGGNESILVVEDDDGVRAAVIDLLSELGYAVAGANGALQALEFLSKNPKIDLLFTDVVMPGPVGSRELARRAKDLVAGIKVLFTSGYTQNAIVHNGQLDDDVVLLSKPYRKDDLARKLRQMLEPAPDAPPPAAAASSTQPTDTRVTEKSPRKILVVEDEALIRMTTLDMVEELGHAFAEAADGPSALEILKSDPEIGALLTDLGLPGMRGTELVAEARKLRPDLKVIIASGYSTETAAGDKGLENVTYLGKPFNLAQLRMAIEGA